MSWNFVEKDAQLSLEVEKNQNEIAALRKQVNSLQTELGSTKVKIFLSMDFITNVIDVSDGVKVHVYSVQVMILFFETVGKVGRCRGRLRSSFAVDRTT